MYVKIDVDKNVSTVMDFLRIDIIMLDYKVF